MKLLRFALAVIALAIGVSAPATAQATEQSSAVMTIQAAPHYATVPGYLSIDTSDIDRPSNPGQNPLEILGPLGILFAIGALKTVAADKDTYPASQSTRVQLNKAIADMYYFIFNRPAWQVAALAVAPPVVATGTTTSKVKTTATTQMFLNGIPKSLTATDDLWTLTGGNLAIGAVRKYLLLWDGTSGTTVVSVLASDDKVIANFADSAAALAACRFPSLPALGTGIVGVLSIVNITNAFVPGTTLLGAAGVTATYRDGPDDVAMSAAQVTP